MATSLLISNVAWPDGTVFKDFKMYKPKKASFKERCHGFSVYFDELEHYLTKMVRNSILHG